MRYLYMTLLVVLGASCSGPMDKSIFEPLTTEELAEEIANDTTFEDTYRYLKYARDSMEFDEVDRAKFSELTYERVHDYFTLVDDTTKMKPYREKFEADWQREYGVAVQKVDSLSEYWQQYMAENSADNYVMVEFAGFDKSYYSYGGGIKDIHVAFRFTPKVDETIEQVVFTYWYASKTADIDPSDDDLMRDLSHLLDKSRCRMTTNFSRPITRYWEASYTDKSVFENYTKSSFLDDFNMHIDVEVVRFGGKNYSDDNLPVPEAIKTYLEHQNDSLMGDYYAEKVVEELIMPDFLREYEYIGNRMDSIYKAEDELVYKLDVRISEQIYSGLNL